MAILRPLKIIITNYNENATEYITLANLPGDGTRGARKVPFSRELWIERDDFMENPPKNYFRLAVGRWIRLKGAYIILCEEIIKDTQGNIIELLCKYFPETRSGNDQPNIKVKATIHWLSIPHAVPAEMRLYDRLFDIEDPEEQEDTFINYINENSKRIVRHSFVETALAEAPPNVPFQFIRLGYFIKDKDSAPGRPVFNRTVELKNDWGKNGR
jgi:glutaminyl-tRNA synthetase